jgi:hypothetical protein
MAQHKVKPNQNIFDIALELSGSIEGIFDLLISNEWLSVNTELQTGMLMEYHDYFVINEGIFQGIRENKYTPSNGERHVYYKNSEYELIGICKISSDKKSSVITMNGNGIMQIDWGDNSKLQTITLSNDLQEYIHYFDNELPTRKIKIYGTCELITFDTSKIGGDLYLTRQLTVDEYVNKLNGYSLKGLLLFKGTVRVDLQGMVINDLLPIGDMSLQELNLLNVKYTDIGVLDDYLEYIVKNYESRRDCTVYLDTEPSERGMQAIQTIINEPEWNKSGKWKFIINEEIYTEE